MSLKKKKKNPIEKKLSGEKKEKNLRWLTRWEGREFILDSNNMDVAVACLTMKQIF